MRRRRSTGRRPILPFLVAVFCGGGAACDFGLLPEPGRPGLVLREAPGVAPVARIGLVAPGSRLETRPEPRGVGLGLTRWLRLELRGDYRPASWALGFTGLRATTTRVAGRRRATFLTADFEGGAGAGLLSGGPCMEDDRVCGASARGSLWSGDLVYGAYLGAGGGLRLGALALFMRTRIDALHAGSLQPAYRLTTSLGGQIVGRGGLRLYGTVGYLYDWDELGAAHGPAAEIGLWVPVDLLGPGRGR